MRTQLIVAASLAVLASTQTVTVSATDKCPFNDSQIVQAKGLDAIWRIQGNTRRQYTPDGYVYQHSPKPTIVNLAQLQTCDIGEKIDDPRNGVKCPFNDSQIVQAKGQDAIWRIAGKTRRQYTPDGYKLQSSPKPSIVELKYLQTCDIGPIIEGYRWRTSATWSACGCDGKQHREVICTFARSVTDSDAKNDPIWCEPSMNTVCGPEPPKDRDCTKPSTCKTYKWYTKTSTCSATCGKGTKTVTADCKDNNGAVVADSYCKDTKPSEKPQDCEAAVSCKTYKWYTKTSECSATCGKGTKSVSVECKDNTGAVVSESFCKDTKPSTSPVPCDAAVSCKTYKWYTTTSTCSATCGAGTKTVSAGCKDNTGAVVAVSFCDAASKPDTSSVPCIAAKECTTYNWYTIDGTCSATCGKGTKSTVAKCRDSTGKTVADSFCSPSTKPQSLTEECSAAKECTTYHYFTKTGDCSVTCGEGVRPVQLICRDQNNVEVDIKLCANLPTPQVIPAPCTAPVSCKTYQWYSQTSECSATCGKGTKTVTLQCKDNTGAVVAESKCANVPKPPTSPVPCEAAATCTTYNWYTKTGDCSVTCGQGVKQTIAKCRDSTGADVADSFCKGVKPATPAVACSAPVSCKSFHYFVQFGACSVTCGDGTKQPTIICQDENDKTVDNALCKDAPQPSIVPVPCSTGVKCGGVVGDPQFVGLRGQSYQVHGVAGQVYNIISDAKTQLNSRFVFLDSGACPVVNGKKQAGCWTHSGSYLGNIALMNAEGDRILLESGDAATGFANVTVNDVELTVGQSAGGLTYVSTHEVSVDTDNYAFTFFNSDKFINQQVSVKDFDALVQQGAHGLLGQTISGKVHAKNLIKHVEGTVAQYAVQDGEFGGDYVFNMYN